MKKILVIGANGFAGRRILDKLSSNGECEVVGCSLHPDIQPGEKHTFVRVDMNDYPAVEVLFDHVCPDVVINCSALSVPDYCEQHREEAYAINVVAVENLAHCCEQQGSRFIHLSTDFVFDGKSDRLYTEEDMPAPLNYYGLTSIRENRRLQGTVATMRLPVWLSSTGKHCRDSMAISCNWSRIVWRQGRRSVSFPTNIVRRLGWRISQMA